jgi:hypothetical protein
LQKVVHEVFGGNRTGSSCSTNDTRSNVLRSLNEVIDADNFPPRTADHRVAVWVKHVPAIIEKRLCDHMPAEASQLRIEANGAKKVDQGAG